MVALSFRALSPLAAVFVVSCAAAQEPSVSVVRPGAPGQPTRAIDPDGSAGGGTATHTEADVRFMQGMIAHHAQAITMSRLAPERTDSEEIRLLAGRIGRSQRDEIALMERWLASRGEEVPDPARGYRVPSDGGADVLKPGMLTDEEMAALAAAEGDEFDRLFLIHMIRHHEGALTMVSDLFATEGSAREVDVDQFASDVDTDQRIEIARMVQMLTENP